MPTSSRRVPTDERPARAVWPRAWWTLRSGPQDGVMNMASDLALLDLADREGAAVLRTYQWSRPTVSFGRNEPVRDAWDVDGLLAAGHDVVRRPTGGRALRHAREVTYSVVMPLPGDTPWRWAYDAVNARLLDALRTLGVPAALCAAVDGPAVAPDGPACFAAPAAGELAVHGRKLVGSAVWRSSGAYLQHGAILLSDSQDQLAPYRLARHAPEPPTQATALEHWLALPDEALTERVIAALHGAWRDGAATIEAWPTKANELGHVDAARHHATTLRDPAWLWRR